MVKSPAGCWRSRPFGLNRSFWLNAVEIPGTSAGGGLCPWPTLVVIPMKLALETGKVLWVGMGLWRVLFLAEVSTFPSKSQDPSPGSKVVDLEVKSCRVSSAVSGRAGFGTEPALGCSATASWRPTPQNLNRFGS
jgi:hypothetical protein